MEFINSFKGKIEIDKEEEFCENDTLICKKCKTPRIFTSPDKKFITRVLCECQQKELKELEQKDLAEKKKQYSQKRLLDIGINAEKYADNKFNQSKDYQKVMVKKVQEFLEAPKKNIIITGKSGAGKTHILTSALINLINKGFRCEYLKWHEQGKFLKSIINNTYEYKREINKYKHAGVLYIDDFLKAGKNNPPSQADVSLAYEIIDYRKEFGLTTLISTERNLLEIDRIDSALGGRLLELCRIRVELKDFKSVDNYRLKL